MSEGRWFYLDDSTPTGPFAWPRLMELWKAGLVTPNTYVWGEGSTNEWVTLASVTTNSPAPYPPLPETARTHVDSELVQPSVPDVAGSDVPDIADQRGWTSKPPAPWRRYGARMLDTTIHGLLGALLLGFAWYSIAPLSAESFFAITSTPAGPAVDLIMTVVLAALVGGVVVGATGSSIGKSIFGMKVVNPDLHAIGIAGGLMREFRVLLFGMGLGLPIIILITMIVAHGKLTKDGATSWDLGRHVVLYRPNGSKQYALNAIGIIFIILMFGFAKALSRT